MNKLYLIIHEETGRPHKDRIIYSSFQLALLALDMCPGCTIIELKLI